MNMVIGGVVIAVAAVYLFLTTRIVVPLFGGPVDARAFPRLLGVLLLIAGVLLVVEDRRKAWKKSAPAPSSTEPSANLPLLGGMVVAMALYFALFEPLGYILATTLFLLVFTCYFHRGKWIANVAVSVIFPVTSYLVLDKLLGLALPRGSIF